ncbi:MAG: VOC family protein [bacterium]|nr:VOC family protein [bacterium]
MKSNALIPELIVNDFQKSLHFYVKVLGFKIEYDRPERKFAMLSLQGSQIMINEKNGTWETGKLDYPLGIGINFQIKVDDVQSLLTLLKEQNYSLYEDVTENWYRKGSIEVGHSEFLVQDPDGYLLRFCQNLGERAI